MSKILVAGAGHGGLTAAINLAKNGYDVTVIEAKSKDKLGHDWHDSLNMSAFDMSGIARPDSSLFSSEHSHLFRNPSHTVCIETPQNGYSVSMDRKALITYLVECAEKSGVRFLFNHKAISPIVHNATVKGLNIASDSKQYRLTSDLVIDAAGMYSPVRTQLPYVCNIQKKIEEKGVFHVFRAYYKNKDSKATDTPYVIDLFHMNRPGLDWIITHEDYVDILIGKFSCAGKLTQEEVDRTLYEFRKEYPYIGESVIRGGTFADIPITKMLPLIVCDGYAAVGDSAGMTIPISGSGIVLSMKAGKILADTVIKSNGKCEKEYLWKYEYEYFKSLGHEMVAIDIIKNLFTDVTGEQVDFLLENEILSPDIIALKENFFSHETSEYLKHISTYSRPIYKFLRPRLKNLRGLPLLPILNKTIPEEYDEKGVRNWIKLYSSV